MPSDIKECSLYSFTVHGVKTKTTPKDITARALAQEAKELAQSSQDALTSAQLDAVNSGITAAKVTAYDALPQITSGSLTFNNTSYNLNYVSSASGSWVKIGNVVTFQVTYTMAAAISALLANVFTGFPTCPIISHHLSESTTREVAARHVSISGTSGNIAGSHASGATYYASGSYITTD